MKYKIVEATGGTLYLKAIIGRFTEADWSRQALAGAARDLLMTYGSSTSLLKAEGHTQERSFFILDLSSGTGGAVFSFGGNADYDVADAPAIL